MSKVKVITRYNDDIIEQSLNFYGQRHQSAVRTIKLKEKGVKNALISLGVETPPTGNDYIIAETARPKGVF